MQSKPSFLMPALIGGSVFGFVGGIPLVGALNCACCALVIGCGVLAAYLHSNNCKQAGVPFTTGDGALVGLVAAVPYSIVTSVVAGVFAMILPSADPEDIVRSMEDAGLEVPPEALEWMASLMAGGVVAVIFNLFLWLALGLVFSTIGGLIGGAAFKSEPPPPPPATTVDVGGGSAI